MKIFPSYFQKCRRFKDIKYDKYDTERSHKMCHKKVSQKRVPKKYPKKVSEKCMVILANLVHLVNLVRPYVQIYAI